MPNLFRASNSPLTTTRYIVENVLSWDAQSEWSRSQIELCGGKIKHLEAWGKVSEEAISATVENGETMSIYHSFDAPLPKGRGYREEMLRNNGTLPSS